MDQSFFICTLVTIPWWPPLVGMEWSCWTIGQIKDLFLPHSYKFMVWTASGYALGYKSKGAGYFRSILLELAHMQASIIVYYSPYAYPSTYGGLFWSALEYYSHMCTPTLWLTAQLLNVLLPQALPPYVPLY